MTQSPSSFGQPNQAEKNLAEQKLNSEHTQPDRKSNPGECVEVTPEKQIEQANLNLPKQNILNTSENRQR